MPKQKISTPGSRISRLSGIMAIVLLLALVVSACASATEAPTPTATLVPPTEPPPPTAVPPTAEPTAEPTPAGPVAVLPTPAAGTPGVQAITNTRILAGPGTQYPVYGSMLNGVTATVVGVSEDSTFWVVSVPVAPTGQGWVDAATVTASNTDGVPVVATPPIPPTVVPTEPAATDPQVTAIDNVNVRSGPGTQWPAYGVAAAGTSGIVLGVSEDSLWWMVRLSPERVGAGFGWVSADWVTSANTDGVPVVKAPPAPTTATIPPPPAGVPTATALDFVNLRSGPGTNYPVLAVAGPGATSEVVGRSEDGEWWVVVVPTTISSNGQAWVSAFYTIAFNVQDVPVIPAPPAPPTVTPTPPESGSIVGTAIEPINVRSGPGSSYPSYGVVPAGTQGQVIGMNADGSWYQVVVPTSVAASGNGWVSASYVVLSGGTPPVVAEPAPPASVEPAPPTGSGPTATALDAINVRSGPGTNYPSYGVAPAGSTAPVVGVSTDGGWWQISVSPDNIPEGVAWVSGDYVSVTDAASVPVVEAPAPPTEIPPSEPPAEGSAYGIAIDTINVRSGPGNEYASYGVVSPGASAPIIGRSEDGSWWVISISTSVAPDGQGWVSAAYVDAYNVQDVPVIPAP